MLLTNEKKIIEKHIVHKTKKRNNKNYYKESTPETENCEFKTYSVQVEGGSLGAVSLCVMCCVLWCMGSQTAQLLSDHLFYVE